LRKKKKVKHKKNNTSQNMQTKEDGSEQRERDWGREIEIALTMINPLMLSNSNIIN